MKHKINHMFVLAALQLTGCSTFQSATYSTPTIESKNTPQFPYGDGIAFKLPEICVAVREGLFGADYRNNFAGPLIFTFFPLEIFAPEHKVDFYEIELDLAPLGNAKPITFEPNKVTLKLNDGTTHTPYAYRLWHFRSKPEPIKTIDQLEEPIVLRETNTNVSLRFKKEDESVQMSALHLDGVYQNRMKLDLPTIAFSPRTTHYRFVFSGSTKENIPMSLPIVEKCHQ